MSAGLLTERLVIRRAVETADNQGGAAVTWTTDASLVATIPAELQPIQAQVERSQAESMGSIIDYRFRVRLRSDITPSMRAYWTPRWPRGVGEIVMEIHGVTLLPDRMFMRLDCGVRS